MMKPLTRENLKSDDVSIVFDFDAPSDILFVCFSGLGLGVTVPPFEFTGVLRNYPVKKIFVRDLEQYCYHAGLKGLTNNIPETAELLTDLFAKSGAKKIVTIGNCQGAYGAAMFGALCGADEILAFAPLTFLSEWQRWIYWETRWKKHFKAIQRHPNATKPYLNLRNVPGLDKPDIHIHYDISYKADRRHAERMKPGYDNIQFYTYEGGQHLLVRKMKKSGKLDEVLRQAAELPVEQVS
jgi:hypothetical protein